MRNPYALIKQSLLEEQAIEINYGHAKKIIEVFPEILEEVDGLPYDTVSREYVTEGLVRLLFKDSEPPLNHDLTHERAWSWPCNGDSIAYKEEFARELQRLAVKQGIKINW